MTHLNSGSALKLISNSEQLQITNENFSRFVVACSAQYTINQYIAIRWRKNPLNYYLKPSEIVLHEKYLFSLAGK
jgi:FKBP-type peptidyl-prolyl cis-trans isomerase (trigger factor)